MQVILREDVKNLGRSGEVVNVKPGYGRNYLIPKGLAVVATPKNVARLEHEKRVISARASKLSKDAQSLAERIEAVTVNIARAVGEEDKLFGSVTGRDIAEALAESGVQVDHRKIHLSDPIKTLGLHEVPVRLGGEVHAKVKVWVVKKE
ncbi:MAG TPA: 50S ribosomal protein L9 [Polyangia bacterium]|nr:50S ribosomal protein L9 [Polyangia bacterium]